MQGSLLQYLILPLLFYFNPESTTKNKWVVTGSSKLEIHGTTNVNKFKCLSTKYNGGDTLTESFNSATRLKMLDGQVKLRSANFDCQHNLITRDLIKTLKAELYPEVKIKFLQLKEGNEGKSYSGLMEITIAGVSKKYPVTCSVQVVSPREKYFVGTNYFELTDFKLEPPEKLFGTIKVHNKVSVNFRLQLSAI